MCALYTNYDDTLYAEYHTAEVIDLRNNMAMLSEVCRLYRYDSQHRQIIDGVKCIFVNDEELTKCYVNCGFDVLDENGEKKKSMTAMDRHVLSWEYIGRARRTTINGISGTLIPLSATS